MAPAPDEDLAQVFATDAPRGLVLVFSFHGTDARDLGRCIQEGLDYVHRAKLQKLQAHMDLQYLVSSFCVPQG